MIKCKVFIACILAIGMILPAVTLAGEKPVPGWDGTDRLTLQLNGPVKVNNPGRDDDDYITYRFIVSEDGGRNWSGVIGIGDHGMWASEEDMNWNAAQYDMGTVVDQNNCLHYIAVMDGYTEFNNPDERVNGVYDICTDMTAENVTYTMIAAMGDNTWNWADGGIDGDGNLYAIWVAVVGEAESAEIWAAKTTDGDWGNPVRIAEGLDASNYYTQMTYDVGEYFYVIYQMPNAETLLNDHYVVKVPASLMGDITVTNTGGASGSAYSYYITAVSPIAQDVDAGYIYYVVRDQGSASVLVGLSTDGVNWDLVNPFPDGIGQRYPSMSMDVDNQVPYVFSNYGVPAGGTYHKDWYTWDDLGYNGGDWQPEVNPDSLLYTGTIFDLLYVHNGVWTTDGDLVSGCNVWDTFTPEGFRVNVWDSEAGEFLGPQTLFSIWTEGQEMVGGYITQCHLLSGPENSVWVAFNSRYGMSDLEPPMFTTTDMSSVMLGEPKVVSVEVTDASPLYVYNEDPLMYYIMFNWIKVSDDTAFVWDVMLTEDMNVDDEGHGTYFFTMPEEVAYQYWQDDTLRTRYEPLAAGDMVYFYSDGYDEGQNYGAEHNGDWYNVWTVNEGWTEVKGDNSTLPLEFQISANYPNPFNSATVIPFTLSRPAKVTVKVYDVSGRLVRTLFDGVKREGQQHVTWYGDGVTSGVYLYTVEVGGVKHVGKMTLLR